MNETVFLSLLANAVNSGYDRGERVPCHVNLLARTVFENICFPFFLRELTSISRQNWFCEEIPSSQNSDKHCFERVKVNYSKSGEGKRRIEFAEWHVAWLAE